MKKILKKALAALLVVVMLLSVASVSAFAAGSKTYRTGDIMEFGSYPQSRVKDSSTISKLDAVKKNWISYGYYSGTGDWDDGNMAPSDYMKYCDITLDGNKYRAVTFNSYRPSWTGNTSAASNTYQNGNGYYKNDVYYFKYEPLKWRVLDPDTGLVVCNNVIDSQAYNNYILCDYDNYEYYGDADKTHYASDWEHSSLRAWLNDDFLNTAFTSAQQNEIEEITRENDAIYESEYDSNPTSDKITLLSYWDVTSSEYGFDDDDYTEDRARKKQSTDYAQCQGCNTVTNKKSSNYGNSWWWLRSPYCSYAAAGVWSDGWASSYDSDVDSTSKGVVPAFNFSNLQSYNPDADEKCGEALTWTFDEKIGTLTINGTGNMYDFTASSLPWKKHIDQIKKIVISSKATSIGNYAFTGCKGLTNIIIPSSVTKIGTGAFSGCTGLTKVTIGTGVKNIDSSAFYNCAKIKEVYFLGSSTQWKAISIGFNNSCLTNATFKYKLTGYQTGDVIEFGSYPQSRVMDSITVSKLDAMTKDWISYDYYKYYEKGGWADGKTKPSDFMKYCDIEIEGNKFRAVTFSEYRPCYSDGNKDNYYTHQYDNGYCMGNVYYFKYEPLKWRILDASTGFVVCDSVIDSKSYNNYMIYSKDDEECYGNSEKTRYATNWEHSSLRAWLNDNFLNTAFTSSQQSKIKEMTRANLSTYSSEYDSNPTSDKITLLTYGDVMNKSYGFSDNDTENDAERRRYASDYAKCQGCYIYPDSGTAWWRLRSPGYSYSSAGVVGDGEVSYYYYGALDTTGGIAPALNFTGLTNLYTEEHTHSPKHVVEASTCKKVGREYDICTECNEIFNEKTLSLADHSWGDWKTTKEPTTTEEGSKERKCSVCGEIETKTIAKLTDCVHDWEHIVIPSTCKAAGMEYDVCTECGDVRNDKVLPLADHKYVEKSRESSTCTKKGCIHKECSVCDQTLDEELALADHKYKHIVVASTCSTAGMEYDICTECGKVINDKALPLLAHTWSEWTVTKEPTTTAEGSKERSCTVCGKKETEKIEKLKAIVDDDTGIEISYRDEFDEGTEIKVSEEYDGNSFQLINKNYGEVRTKIFDISTIRGGEKVQPKGEITVKIPLPADFNPNKVFVTYVDSNNGKVTKIDCEVKDGYVVFKTNHFSYYAIVEMGGGVESVSLGNVTMDYKSSKTLTPEIVAAEGTDYTVTYSSDSKNVTVDENGKIYGAKRGSANITVTVTDSQGNTFTDTCKVTVEYTWWQWIIKIVLFGWIWY